MKLPNQNQYFYLGAKGKKSRRHDAVLLINSSLLCEKLQWWMLTSVKVTRLLSGT